MEKLVNLKDKQGNTLMPKNIKDYIDQQLVKQDIITGNVASKCGYKWDGKDVYVKRFDIGQLPNVNRKIETLDLPKNIKVFRIDGTAYKNIGGHPDYCPIYSMTLQLLYRTDAQQLYIDTDKDQSQYNAWVEIYFTYND